MPLLFTIFIILLLLANAFLFRDGLWFYQDQSFWFKNILEAYAFLNTQFHAFNNFLYYMSYDQGVLSANNAFVYTVFYLLQILFGSSGSQIAVSMLGYILAFFSFWAFASLFFKDRKIQIILALIYTFNPLMYSFRGQGLIYATVPLFIFSFYKYYTVEKNAAKYLLLNIVALLLWIANVRFLQANIFIIVPYLLFALLTLQKPRLHLKKLMWYCVTALLILSPIIYSFIAPLFQSSPSIFNFGTVFDNFVTKGYFYDAFSPFQSSNIIIYNNRIYTALGLIFFISVLALVINQFKTKTSSFLKLNMILLILGITFFKLGFIVGRDLYPIVIKFVPFLTNAPFYGYFIVSIPFIFLLGTIAATYRKTFYTLCGCFLLIALSPLLQFSNFIFQKYSINNIPVSYKTYFVDAYYGIPEATHYYPSPCWRANYMNAAHTPTLCINRGLHYTPIALDNPRAISGLEAYLISKMNNNTNINNLRVTHNLKNLIVAKDIVPAFDAGPLHDEKTVTATRKNNELLANNKLLTVLPNEHFNHFIFKDKDSYDFFIYSPQKVVVKEKPESIFDNSLDILQRPVVLSQANKELSKKPLQQNITIIYKQDPLDATKYFIKIENIVPNKPFMVQLNQAFKPGWELVWIDKDIYEKRNCMGDLKAFQITNNKRCQVNNSLFDLDSLNLLQNKALDKNQHVQGNYISNTWIMDSNDIPLFAKDKTTAYAVIIYRNQLYLVTTIIISVSVLLLLTIYTLMQVIKKLVNKK